MNFRVTALLFASALAFFLPLYQSALLVRNFNGTAINEVEVDFPNNTISAYAHSGNGVIGLTADGSIYFQGSNLYNATGGNAVNATQLFISTDERVKQINGVENSGFFALVGESLFGYMPSNTFSEKPSGYNAAFDVSASSSVIADRKIISMSFTETHGVLLDSKGRVYMFVESPNTIADYLCNDNQIANNSFIEVDVPRKFTYMQALANSTVFVDQSGVPYACAPSGMYGLTQSAMAPTSVVPASSALEKKKVVSIASSLYGSIALTSEGKIFVVGDMSFTSGTPAAVNEWTLKEDGDLLGKFIIAITAPGALQTYFALDNTGIVYKWGADDSDVSSFIELPVALPFNNTLYISSSSYSDVVRITDEGFGCDEGSYLEDGECVLCPRGSYCPTSFMKVYCPYGTWSTSGSSSFESCSASKCPEHTTCGFGSVIDDDYNGDTVMIIIFICIASLMVVLSVIFFFLFVALVLSRRMYILAFDRKVAKAMTESKM